MQAIQITNSLTGKKEELQPLEEGHVKMYACGVTVYDHCHIGHAMQAVYFDMIRSYLEYAGYRVTYVRNYTDVDDKIINKAAELGKDPLSLSQEIIQSSIDDMTALGVRPADHEPKVSENIPQIIAMIQELMDQHFAYCTQDGDVYYRVKKKDDYGKLSNRKVEDLLSNTRKQGAVTKEDQLDFALWKKDDTAGASWNSPWGKGRPGWHIECSAMAKRYLGDSFDIHGGGRDLIFPHHENEIAQSEAANCCQYATIWMHSGLLTIDKQKMSKSIGNHIPIKDFILCYPGEVLRLAYLQYHYSSNVDFSESAFKACLRRLLYYYETLAELDQFASKSDGATQWLEGHDPEAMIVDFEREMNNDFSTVCALRDLLKAMRSAKDLLGNKRSPAATRTAAAYAQNFRKLFGVLGLLQQEPQKFMDDLKEKILPTLDITVDEITKAIADRRAARAAKDFAKSDEVRDVLLKRGIVLQDTPEGTRWTICLND